MQGFLPGVKCHARPLPWTTGESGRPITHSSFLYLQRRERPDSPVVQGRGRAQHSTPGRKPWITVWSYRQAAVSGALRGEYLLNCTGLGDILYTYR